MIHAHPAVAAAADAAEMLSMFVNGGAADSFWEALNFQDALIFAELPAALGDFRAAQAVIGEWQRYDPEHDEHAAALAAVKSCYAADMSARGAVVITVTVPGVKTMTFPVAAEDCIIEDDAPEAFVLSTAQAFEVLEAWMSDTDGDVRSWTLPGGDDCHDYLLATASHGQISFAEWPRHETAGSVGGYSTADFPLELVIARAAA